MEASGKIWLEFEALQNICSSLECAFLDVFCVDLCGLVYGLEYIRKTIICMRKNLSVPAAMGTYITSNLMFNNCFEPLKCRAFPTFV